MNGLLRGVRWYDGARPVRADPADRDRLPADTWDRATVPAGVRLEFMTGGGGARAVEVAYSGSAPLAADAYRPSEPVFTLLRGEDTIAEAAAKAAPDSVVRLELPPDEGPFTLHLPETLRPVLHSVRGIGGALDAVPARPPLLVYGDSIAEGWSASRPHRAWPAVAGRALGLDTVNLGYAGAARGELASAEQLAALPGAVITVAFGTNCWSRTPHSAPLLREQVCAFLALVRRGHPHTPLLVASPVLRPDAEDTPNALGATLAELRSAVEEAARAEGVALLPGAELLRAEHLVDGVHPGDAGHARIATATAKALRPLLGDPPPVTTP
ncbi:GDSL-type esterase/lipase family protein [Streptomyces monticola]|uniref:GDSL-type esterase/lipase family protein n=1 Tax=Streptomyces monticola TaxID=2666263 RepID=A0ABW2JQ93_9ACTN